MGDGGLRGSMTRQRHRARWRLAACLVALVWLVAGGGPAPAGAQASLPWARLGPIGPQEEFATLMGAMAGRGV